MRSRRSLRPQRRPVFLGCEGESELGYGSLIREFREEFRADIHLMVELLRPGGGDPLSLLELARHKILSYQRNHEMRCDIRAVLLDTDQLRKNPARDTEMFGIAKENGIRLILQEPSHEGLLLRHIDGCHSLRPPTAAAALAELRRHWPDYTKGSSAARLATRIRLEHVRQAATVEPELVGFLRENRVSPLNLRGGELNPVLGSQVFFGSSALMNFSDAEFIQ